MKLLLKFLVCLVGCGRVGMLEFPCGISRSVLPLVTVAWRHENAIVEGGDLRDVRLADEEERT